MVWPIAPDVVRGVAYNNKIAPDMLYDHIITRFVLIRTVLIITFFARLDRRRVIRLTIILESLILISNCGIYQNESTIYLAGGMIL